MVNNRQPAPSGDKPSEAELKVIIQGDPVESARKTNEWGERLGTALAKNLATSQIRNLFGAVRLIEMNWPREVNSEQAAQAARAAERDLILLQPKLRYQAERQKPVRELADVLIPAIQFVNGDRVYFQRFVDFFEAILAYHKAAGGKD